MESSLQGGRVIVGIDFSDSSERALIQAVALAEREHASLELLHVFEWESPAGRAGPAGREPADREPDNAAHAEIQSLARAARRQLAALCSSLVGDRVHAEIQVRIGDPAVELRRAAERPGTSLLVLGVHGRRGNSPGTVGRTVEKLCAGSPVPVLLVEQDPATGQGRLVRPGLAATGALRHRPPASGLVGSREAFLRLSL
ncbi:MAG: universal stress protein [Polyangia bacterium]